MSTILTIAAAEWRLWMRSRSALAALFAVVLIIAATSILTAARFTEERHERTHQQELAEETFLAQPARHPHRMVHYGHYVFRTPPPLAIIDPGVDTV
ncbi:MAG: delta 1-pyrroline-5-carboxylate reductase, partial [Acidobacteriota bacterium]